MWIEDDVYDALLRQGTTAAQQHPYTGTAQLPVGTRIRISRSKTHKRGVTGKVVATPTGRSKKRNPVAKLMVDTEHRNSKGSHINLTYRDVWDVVEDPIYNGYYEGDSTD